MEVLAASLRTQVNVIRLQLGELLLEHLARLDVVTLGSIRPDYDQFRSDRKLSTHT